MKEYGAHGPVHRTVSSGCNSAKRSTIPVTVRTSSRETRYAAVWSDGQVYSGANFSAWRCNGGGNQKWILCRDGTVVSLANRDLCLDADASNGDVGPGANVTAWSCNGGSNQKWSWSS